MKHTLRNDPIGHSLQVFNLVVVSIISLPALSILALVIVFGEVRPVTAEFLRETPVHAMIVLTVPMLVSLFALPFIWERWARRTSSKELLLTLPEGRRELGLLFACLGASAAATIWSLAFHKNIFPVIHFGVVAIAEEFLMRSVLQQRLTPLVGRWGAIAVTAVVFAFLLHIGRPIEENVFVRLPIGFVLGGSVVVTRSLWSAVALHYVYNLFAVG